MRPTMSRGSPNASQLRAGCVGDTSLVQPVFDAIAVSAAQLCNGLYGFVGRFDGEQIHIAAHHNYSLDALRVVQEMYPMRPSRQQVSGCVILTRSVVHIEDLREDPEYAQRLRLPSAAARPHHRRSHAGGEPRRDPRSDHALPNGATAPRWMAPADRSVDRLRQLGVEEG